MTLIARLCISTQPQNRITNGNSQITFKHFTYLKHSSEPYFLFRQRLYDIIE